VQKYHDPEDKPILAGKKIKIRQPHPAAICFRFNLAQEYDKCYLAQGAFTISAKVLNHAI